MHGLARLVFLTQLAFSKTDPIRVSGGLVEGTISPDGSHMRYYGIPYATVHTRFQEALPDPQWSGVMQATNNKVVCSQRFAQETEWIVGQEDCLVLNVYVPTSDTTAGARPVMVFIHGGGFKDGSGQPFVYGPDYIIKHDVILVTFNYRLEILGFLCLGNKEAPGNIGLKDQVEALRWVQRNIRAFGGDPDNVTIFGESAGSVSVSYHLLSPMSRGLFKRAIMESGTALSPWGLQLEPVEIAHTFTRQLGQDSNDLHEIVKVLKDKSDKDLLMTRIPRVAGQTSLFDYNFSPCVEKEIPGVERFLPDHPYTLLSTGDFTKVPVIIGYNNEEGYWFVSKENSSMLETFDFTVSLPPNLQFSAEVERQEAGKELKRLYLPNKAVSEETRIEFSEFEGDAAVKFPACWALEQIAKSSQFPVFGYKFTHDGKLNFLKKLIGYGKYPGAAHADDLPYLFKTKFTFVTSKEDKDVINKMTKMWTNFAKYSDPTPEITSLLPMKWKPIDKNNPQIFVIDNELSYAQLYENDRLKFWRKLYMSNLRKA